MRKKAFNQVFELYNSTVFGILNIIKNNIEKNGGSLDKDKEEKTAQLIADAVNKFTELFLSTERKMTKVDFENVNNVVRELFLNVSSNEEYFMPEEDIVMFCSSKIVELIFDTDELL
jgi:hypothetical protein